MSVKNVYDYLHCSLCNDQIVKEEDIYKTLSSQIKAVKLWAKVFRIYESMKSKH